MNYFDIIPNDILQIILGFIDSLRDSFTLLLVCKRFYNLIKPNESKWKMLCLEFWRDYKQGLTSAGPKQDHFDLPLAQKCLTKEGHWDFCKQGQYDLETAVRVCGKDWFWISKCFVNEKIQKFPSEYHVIEIGRHCVFPERSAWSILICFGRAYIGNFNEKGTGDGTMIGSTLQYVGHFSENFFDGAGTLTYDTGVKYEGQWFEGQLCGTGTVTYPDGIQYTGQWEPYRVSFDARHPTVRECVDEKKLCTNTLGDIIIPQQAGGDSIFCCETCWIYCHHQSPLSLWWNSRGMKCECNDCSILKK
jgi:hypothetical protein